MRKYIKKNYGIIRQSRIFGKLDLGIERRLRKLRIKDMYDISNTDPKILYKEFGVNAEFLIDHSNGIESCTINDIKKYNPKSNSMSSSQILPKDYNYEDARLALKEMIELLCLNLIEKNIVTDTIKLYIGYSKDIIKATGGSRKISNSTNLYSILSREFNELYDKTTNKEHQIRRIGIVFERLSEHTYEQLDLFNSQKCKDKENKMQKVISDIKNNLGKNAILRGINLQENATTILRNKLIGGHNGGE